VQAVLSALKKYPLKQEKQELFDEHIAQLAKHEIGTHRV